MNVIEENKTISKKLKHGERKWMGEGRKNRKRKLTQRKNEQERIQGRERESERERRKREIFQNVVPKQ